MAQAAAERTALVRFRDGKTCRALDFLAVEEPLEIRLRTGGRTETLLVTMRTPGHDEELALGLLFAEGILREPADVLDVGPASDTHVPPELRGNTVVVSLREECGAAIAGARRAELVSSACGICGRAAIDRALARGRRAVTASWRIAAGVLLRLSSEARMAQDVFARTGGIHAAALFDLNGRLLAVREDVGRHNAVDKVVGAEWLAGRVPLGERLLFVSGRAGFEIVQKCWMAGVPVIVAVGAPSSLAVDLAEEAGITLVGFLRGGGFNIYTAAHRIRVASGDDGDP